MRLFLLRQVLPFTVALSIYGIFRIWQKYAKILATKFSPLFLLPCYRQIASIFKFISHHSVKVLLLKCLLWIDTRKLHVRIVVPKLQSWILRVTVRVVLLIHCTIPNVPMSPQNLKTIWLTKLLRSIAPQNLTSPWSVNFAFKSFQDFTFYVNIETLNTECKSDQEQEMWMWNIYWEMLRIIGWEKSGVPVNISWWIPKLKERDTKYSITQWKLSTKQSWTRNFIIFFNNLKCAAKVNLAFGFILKNIEDGGFRYFFAHENNTPLDRSKLVCTHYDLAKLKDFLNKTNIIESCSRERMNTKWRFYKLTNLTVFAALLNDVPMGCKNAFLPESA